MWGLGCLVWEAFNGVLKQRSNLKDIEHIPKSLQSLYCELVGASPSNRPNPADIITRCRKPGGFFKNDLVDTLLFLEEIHGQGQQELGALHHHPVSCRRFPVAKISSIHSAKIEKIHLPCVKLAAPQRVL